MNETERALYKQIQEQVDRLNDLFVRLFIRDDTDHVLTCLVNLVMDGYFKQEMYQTLTIIAAERGYVPEEGSFRFQKEEEE